MLTLALLGCTLDQLRSENEELKGEVDRLEEEMTVLEEEVAACKTLHELEASAGRNFDPPSERCENGVFNGDPGLLSAGGIARSVRLLPSENGLRIVSIKRDSLPSSCGFANGDVITSVDGLPVASIDDWGSPTGGQVTFVALRGGEPVSWTLVLD